MSTFNRRRSLTPRHDLTRGTLTRPFILLLSLVALGGGYSFFIPRSLEAAVQEKGPARKPGTPEPGPQLSKNAHAQIRAFQAEKKSRTSAQKKISFPLLYAARMKSGKMPAGMPVLQSRVELNSVGQTLIDIRTTETDAVSGLVGKLGGRVDKTYPRWNCVMAWLPLEALETLAADPAVRAIVPPSGAKLVDEDLETKGTGVTPTVAGPPTSVEAEAESNEKMRRQVRDSLETFNRTVAGRRNDGAPVQSAAPVNTPKAVTRARKIGLQTSEGDVTHGADQARARYGVDGTGLKIGVLSDSFNDRGGANYNVLSGDLPGPGNPNGYTTPVQLVGSGDLGLGFPDRGRRMLQIVHDLAPGAQLYFATGFNGPADFASNILALRAAGCDIIIDDVFLFLESGLHKGQTGGVVSTDNLAVIQQAVNDVTADGVLYFSGSGDQGSLTQGTSCVWEGDFVSGGNLPGDPSDVLDWDQSPGVAQSNQVLADNPDPVVFQWADPLGAATDDYDIFLLDAGLTTVLNASANVQDGTQDPVERMVGGVRAGQRLVVVRYAGNPVFLSVNANGFSNGGKLEFGTSGQTRGHAAAENAFCVAYTPARQAFGPPTPDGPFPGLFGPSNQTESLSSDGFRRTFFNADGTAITPGNFLSTGGQLLQKPELTAASGVVTSGFNLLYWSGGGAAHAGAIAALVKSASPTATPSQIRNILQSTALDIMAPGVDRDSGYGIIQALPAVAATGAPQVVNLASGTVTLTEVGGNGNGGVDPGESATLTVQLTNIGGVGATGVSATLTSTTPCVTVGTATSAYPNLASDASGVNATPFTFTLSPGCPCSGPITFNLSVSFDGGSPGIIPITVQTGAPIVISSALDATAPTVPAGFTGRTGTQVGRIARNSSPSVCGANLTAVFADLNPGRRFDAYTFRSTNTPPGTCVTVTLTTPGTSDLQPVAYLGQFDENNILAGRLADSGVSAGPNSLGRTISFSFTIPVNQLVTLTVNDVNTGVTASVPYTLSISGLCGVNGFSLLRNGPASATEVAGPTSSDGDGNFEPCEEIQVTVPLTNTGSDPATSVNATLSTLTPGVIVTQAASAYPVIGPGGTQTSVTPFRFRLAPCFNAGTNVEFTLNATYGGGFGPLSFTFNIPTGCATGPSSTTGFANPTAISIPSEGAATPYPSTINVSGLTGTVTKVTATVTGLSHTWPQDVGVLLVGPDGQTVILFYGAIGDGQTGGVSGRTYTFDQTAATPLPLNGLPESGTYRPNNSDGSVSFEPGVGIGPPYGSDLGVFNGLDAASLNGTWRLYVRDFVEGDSGSIDGGWSLSISTAVRDCSTTATCPVPQVLNSQVGLSVTANALAPSGTACSGFGYPNEITITGTLTNRSASPISCGYFEVVELREANGPPPAVPFRLITDATACAGGGVGTRQVVPTIGPGESLPVTFRIALPSIRRFRFFVNFFGFNNGLTLSRNAVAPQSGPEKGFEVNFTGRGKAAVAVVSRETTDGTASLPRKVTVTK